MSRYYCPYCPSSYHFHRISGDSVLICGQCGDPLSRKPFINSRQIFGFITASAFLAPLLIMIIFVISDLTKEKLPSNSDSLVFLSFK